MPAGPLIPDMYLERVCLCKLFATFPFFVPAFSQCNLNTTLLFTAASKWRATKQRAAILERIYKWSLESRSTQQVMGPSHVITAR